MLGDDSADDGEPQPAPPLLRGVVRHEELVPVRRRDPRSVVREHEPGEIVGRIVLCLDRDRAASAGGLDGVVDQVHEHALDLVGIDADERERRIVARVNPHVAEKAVVQRQRVVQEHMEVDRDRTRGRHPRELRELVDEPLQGVDLGDDGARAFRHQRLRGSRRRTEVASQALGRQLDGRQRVLDLVCEPPCHLPPGRYLLRSDERRHIVEYEDGALLRPRLPVQGARHCRQVDLAIVAHQRDLLRRRFGAAAQHFVQQVEQRCEIAPGEHIVRRAAGRVRIEAEQTGGRGVDRGDETGRVDGNDAGRDSLEHRFDIPPPSFDLDMFPLQVVGGLFQLLAAGRELARHAVERLDERSELVGGFRLQPPIQMAGADLARGRRQHLHRPRDPLGEVQPDPRRTHHDHQREHQEEREVRRPSAAV